MKTILSLLLFVCLSCTWVPVAAQNVGISPGGTPPHPSALLDLDAAPAYNQGFLVPRLSTPQRLAIDNPANGLLVYDINLDGFYCFYQNRNYWDCATTPAGTVTYFANQTPPVGYLECNGQAINRFDFPELFRAIGTLYGAGDGVNTFNVPDLRGEFIRSWDHSRGADPGRAIGTAQDATAIRTLIDNFQGYITGVFAIGLRNTDGTLSGPGSSNLTQGSDTQYYLANGASSAPGSGDNIAHKTRPRNIALMACIKY